MWRILKISHVPPLCISLVCPTAALPSCPDRCRPVLTAHVLVWELHAVVKPWSVRGSPRRHEDAVDRVFLCVISILDFTWLSVNQFKAYSWGMRIQWQLSVLHPSWRDLATRKLQFSCQSLARSWHLKMIHNLLQNYLCERSCVDCAVCWHVNVRTVLCT